ncbi:hypothetical protein ACFQS1_15085 [Paractinoplanes rhizophilus]|jgi:uncharacterized membrane protein|uniref:Uncharacterized protein n=1 Tax=Paractinoplanes rhizophilus TaxID=1416877 RepID=A0ABW2HS26_9ACTN
MPSETELLRSLDPEPPQPSTVDITRAMADGRRRKSRRAVGYAGVAAVTTLAVAGAAIAVSASRAKTGTTTPVAASPSASAKPKAAYTIPGTPGWAAPAATPPTSCTLEELPVPDGVRMALVSGADPTGAYQVGRSYPKGGYQAVIWHNGKAAKVNLPGDLEESLRDVNSAGTAVGWSYQGKSDADTGPVPYAYVHGKVVKLPGVSRGEATAINEAGAIAGEAGDHAVVWPSATAKPIVLPVPKGMQSATATDIDEDGTVVGSLDLKVPYVWFADGTHRALPLPTVDGKTAVSARAFSVRNGWAIGVADQNDEGRAGKPADRIWAVRWNVRTGETLIADDWQTRADARNAQGWEVGITKQGRAALLAGGKRIELPALAQHEPGLLTNVPNAISDDGRVISGQSDDASDTIRAVIWRCV